MASLPATALIGIPGKRLSRGSRNPLRLQAAISYEVISDPQCTVVHVRNLVGRIGNANWPTLAAGNAVEPLQPLRHCGAGVLTSEHDVRKSLGIIQT